MQSLEQFNEEYFKNRKEPEPSTKRGNTGNDLVNNAIKYINDLKKHKKVGFNAKPCVI